MGKEWSFQQMVLEKQDSHKQENETGPLYYNLFKDQLKVKVLNVRPNSINFLEANIVHKLLLLAIFFFQFDTKSKGNKTKYKQVVLCQTTTFYKGFYQ